MSPPSQANRQATNNHANSPDAADRVSPVTKGDTDRTTHAIVVATTTALDHQIRDRDGGLSTAVSVNVGI
jgi:hypothetical protein